MAALQQQHTCGCVCEILNWFLLLPPCVRSCILIKVQIHTMFTCLNLTLQSEPLPLWVEFRTDPSCNSLSVFPVVLFLNSHRQSHQWPSICGWVSETGRFCGDTHVTLASRMGQDWGHFKRRPHSFQSCWLWSLNISLFSSWTRRSSSQEPGWLWTWPRSPSWGRDMSTGFDKRHLSLMEMCRCTSENISVRFIWILPLLMSLQPVKRRCHCYAFDTNVEEGN